MRIALSSIKQRIYNPQSEIRIPQSHLTCPRRFGIKAVLSAPRAAAREGDSQRPAPKFRTPMAKKKAQRYINRLGLHLQRAGQRIRRSGFSNFGEEQIRLSVSANVGEDKILEALKAELLPPDHSRFAVDIGAGDGVRGSNTYAVFRRGWRGLGVEGDERRARRLSRAYRNFLEVEPAHALTTPSNVIALLREHGVPHDFGVLSLDIDSYDYWVLDSILKGFRPRVVVTEINEKIPPPVRFVVRYDPDFRLQHHFFGYSIASLEELCERHSYALLALEYNNAFIAPRELLVGARTLDARTAYRRGYLERPDRRERFPANQDMEALHSLTPAESVEFLEHFFARHKGKYELSVAEVAEPVEGVKI